MSKRVLRHHTHDDGRWCMLCPTNTGPMWFYSVGSAELASIGMDITPYTSICDRDHPDD